MQQQRAFRLPAYWLCQFTGWGIVGMYWYYYALRSWSYWPAAVAVVLLQVVLKMLITHAYRNLAHARGWLAAGLARLIPRIFTAWLVLLAFYTLEGYLIYVLRWGDGYFTNEVYLGAITGGARYMAIWLLAFHGYHFHRQSVRQATEADRQARLASEAHLARLSNDLNPHFLFNALNGIKGLTREDPARARTAIDRLAGILRYSLQRTREPLVSLADERSVIREYLALEKIRFEERLTVEWTLPEDTEHIRLPPLSLHTLVENAVKHGIATVPEGGVLGISLEHSAAGYTYAVTNPRSSKTLHRTSGRAPENFSSGTGLANLRQRLLLQYGPAARLIVLTAPDSFTATMTLPA